MADILHDFPIHAPAADVFRAISTPEGLEHWWTKRSSGTPVVGGSFELQFGPAYEWRARVLQCDPLLAFELEMTEADQDWLGTRVGFRLESGDGVTLVRFHHTGWPESNDHHRTSCYCWAMYLRVLKRNLEFGEEVPYERRLEV
ncbi:MAG: SRPBCC family protein [Gemmatimonadaceae bacterium]